jgi:DNA replication protein DnaC
MRKQKTNDFQGALDHIYFLIGDIPESLPEEEKQQWFDAEKKQKQTDCAKERFKYVYDNNHMPLEFKEIRKFKSDPEIMKVNPEAWSIFKNPGIESNYWVTGPPGTGKTYWAVCVLNWYIFYLQNAAVLPVTAFRGLCSDWDRTKSFKPYMDAKILLIDDIDKIRWNYMELEALYMILDKRHNTKRRTIITSNLDPKLVRDAWCARVPENETIAAAIIDRMLPMKRLVFEGESLRKGMQ